MHKWIISDVEAASSPEVSQTNDGIRQLKEEAPGFVFYYELVLLGFHHPKAVSYFHN